MKTIAGLAAFAANVVLQACSAHDVPLYRETSGSAAGASGMAEAAPMPAGRSALDNPDNPPLSSPGGSSGQVGSASPSPSNGVPGIGATKPLITVNETGSTNPAGLDADAVKRLVAGGPLGTLKWLYPYAGTANYGDLGQHRQLWGAAIDIHPNGSDTTDPSHPAFYVTGQDLDTDNHRAFAVLDGCKPLDSACLTGVDCCTGFCSATCSAPPPPGTCSGRDQHCATSGDCCDPNDYCINDFCAFVPLL